MVEVRQFAENVEHVLEFIIDSMPTDTKDRRALQNLKEDAANIKANLGVSIEVEAAMEGIGDVIRA